MGTRSELQTILESITSNVYFQPPESIKLSYPCIIYTRDSGITEYADDTPYSHKIRYRITVIDRNPDSLIVTAIARMPTSRFDRHFTNDNLNHDVFNIYY
jgi:hypothetical protein